MFNTECEKYLGHDSTEPIVTYTGALTCAKGFHVLAKSWKTIIDAVPNAQLFVIGSGNLYNDRLKLGEYGIADQQYEQKFIKYLLDKNGEIIPSVHFLGVLGEEKNEIYNKTRVGIVNPTARTEICSISAIEMQACSIPVVSRNKNGMPDVISNGKTGLLARNDAQFTRFVIQLLKDKELNGKLSSNCREYIFNKFNPNYISLLWKRNFEEVFMDEMPKFVPPKNNWGNNYKWIRLISRYIHLITPFKNLPSIAEIECYCAAKIRNLR